MSQSILTQARLRELLDYDPQTGVFTRLANRMRPDLIGKPAGRPNTAGHIQIMLDGIRYMAHHLAWFWTHNQWPTEIDHRNRVKADNRIDNLCDGTRAENQHNVGKRKDNWSGVIGVVWRAKNCKWYASIQANKKQYFLGSFSTLGEATAVRRAAKLIYHPTAPTQ